MVRKLLICAGIAIIATSLAFLKVSCAALTAAECKAEVEKAAAVLASEGEAGIAKVKEVRFAGGEGYIWIHDMDGIMVMHPIKPELDGKNVLGNTDPNGKPLFAAMNALVEKNGQGWVMYMWPKPGAKDPSQKASFVKLVNCGGKKLVVGCGLYDVTEADIKKDFPGDAVDAE